MKSHHLLPKKIILTGGKQRTDGYDIKEWAGYSLAVAISVENENENENLIVKEVINYKTPKKYLAEDEDASITFKSGHLINGELWISTQTEVLCFDPTNYEIICHFSHHLFNDVHHITVTSQNTLVITSTGLDAIFEYSRDGKLLNEWSCTGAPIWDKFDSTVDYRKVITTKPHTNHPNFCFEFEGNYWVSRLKNKDCYCLNTGEIISLATGEIHDGILVGKHAYFTHVNGYISKVDMKLKKVVKLIDMNPINESTKELGWCRGLHYINEDTFLVGFTRIRPSKYHQGLEWLKNKIHAKGWLGCQPTRVCLLNTKKMAFEWEINLEEHNINAVFSIL